MPKVCACGKEAGWMVRTTRRFSYGIARGSVQLCWYSDGRGKLCYGCAKKEKERRTAELAQKG